MRIMKAAVLVEPAWIVLNEKPVPGRAGRSPGPHHHDHHLRYRHPQLKGKYPVERGRIVGHEPAGLIEELGQGVRGYQVGQRVIVGAIAPCRQCYARLGGHKSQCGADPEEGYPRARGGWRLRNTIDGCQAEYVRVPDAMADLTPVPDELSDE